MRDKQKAIHLRLRPGNGSPDALKLATLPSEVLTNIVKHVTRKNLFKLQRLSKQFFVLATAELYSVLEFRFTTSDARDFDTPLTRLSDALQSIIASDYDYAQHIKAFKLSISPESPVNATMMTRFLWGSDLEPSKTLNATLLLVLRKAKAMETFAWFVPVELNGLVYKALQQIPTLANLGMYLGGNPINMSFHTTYGGQAFPPNLTAGANPAQATANTILSATPGSSNPYGDGPSWSKRSLSKSSGRYDYWKDRRTLSKFSGLRDLTLLDLADLDCLEEIAGCLRTSSSTLRSFTLSLSWDLALKARKPETAAPVVAEDMSDPMTESDDEPADPPTTSQTAPTFNADDTRKDRIAQEAILATIFNEQEVADQGVKLEKKLALSKDKPVRKKSVIPLLQTMLKLVRATMSETDFSDPEVKRLALELKKTVAEASSKVPPSLLGSIWNNQSAGVGSSSSSALEPLWNSFPPPETAAVPPVHIPMPPSLMGAMDTAAWDSLDDASKQSVVDDIYSPHGINTSSVLPLPSLTATGAAAVPTPLLSLPDPEPQPNYGNEDSMDVDMDHPDESGFDVGLDEEIEDDETGTEVSTDANNGEAVSLGSPRKRARFGAVSTPNSPTHASRSSQSIKGKGKEVETMSSVEVSSEPPNAFKTQDQLMQDYVRITHGLQLEELKLYLVPLKASIVARALDLRVLRHIMLLEVGPQVAFWNLLHRLSNSISGIGFDCIHTDDVSHALLTFLATTTHSPKELYFHKRKKKVAEPDATAGPLNTTSIFKVGLRKHLKTLTHLMLKNDTDDTWDLDERTVRWICLKGKALIELGVGMRIKTMHTLIQNIPQLTSLRVLHFLSLRTTNAMNLPPSILELEPVTFLSDAITSLPDRSLRYVAVGERYATVETPAEIQKRRKALVEKAKKAESLKEVLAQSKASGRPSEGGFPNSGTDDANDSWDEAGREYAEMKAKETQLRWSTRFSECKDVKIFQKVKRSGKLT